MTMSNDKAKYRDIIKYSTDRQYFGVWTPKQLHYAYKVNLVNEQSVNLQTNKFSVDRICDALWTEMSYNPVRFGSTSPFMFNEQNSITQFCANYEEHEKNPNTADLFMELRKELTIFTSLFAKYDPNFQQKNISKKSTVNIKLQEYSLHSNNEYKMLACLVRCIHLICTQNLKDFDSSKQHRERMKKVIERRHPDFVRSIKIPNFAKLEPLFHAEYGISLKMANVQSEIYKYTMIIENYKEMEFPVDTQTEKRLLREKEREYEELGEQLDFVHNKIKQYSR